MHLHIKKFFRFVLLAFISFAANICLTAFGHELLELPEKGAFAVSLVTVFFINFIMNRHYVFEAQDANPRKQLVLFLVSSLCFRLAEYCMFLLAHMLFNIHYLITVAAILIMSFMLKFFYYGSFVFKPLSN